MSATRFEHFEHGADIGVRGFGATMAEAFEQAALALTAVVVDPGRIDPHAKVDLACRAPEPELLLVDWLNAVVYEMAVRRYVFGRFEVRLTDDRLEAAAWGEPLDAARHDPKIEVKGATYTCLGVERGADGQWLAQCVVDV